MDLKHMPCMDACRSCCPKLCGCHTPGMFGWALQRIHKRCEGMFGTSCFMGGVWQLLLTGINSTHHKCAPITLAEVKASSMGWLFGMHP